MRGIKPLKWDPDPDPDYRYLRDGLWLHDWAWEFLRRNPDYIAAYERWFAAESGEAKVSPANKAKLRVRASFGFGLLTPYDPDDSPIVHGSVTWADSSSVFIVEELPASSAGEGARWPGYPEVALLQFRLDLPIEAQLKSAGRLLDRSAKWVKNNESVTERRPKIKPQMDKFPLYVRFLDGAAEEVGAAEMGRRLLSGKDPSQAGQKALKRAQKMAREDYRQWLLYPDRWSDGLNRGSERPK